MIELMRTFQLKSSILNRFAHPIDDATAEQWASLLSQPSTNISLDKTPLLLTYCGERRSPLQICKTDHPNHKIIQIVELINKNGRINSSFLQVL